MGSEMKHTQPTHTHTHKRVRYRIEMSLARTKEQRKEEGFKGAEKSSAANNVIASKTEREREILVMVINRAS